MIAKSCLESSIVAVLISQKHPRVTLVYPLEIYLLGFLYVFPFM